MWEKEIAIDVEQILLREGILRDWDYKVMCTSAEISKDAIYSSISLQKEDKPCTTVIRTA